MSLGAGTAPQSEASHFVFSDPLDLLSRPRTPPPRPGPGGAPRKGPEKEHCILLVDDEPDTLEAVTELLEDEGFQASQARHGAEALELLRAGLRPSLILLDLRMPVMDGFEFLRRISSEPQLADIPIAVVTASPSLEDLPPRKNDAGYFRKPVDYERLLKVVRQYCR